MVYRAVPSFGPVDILQEMSLFKNDASEEYFPVVIFIVLRKF